MPFVVHRNGSTHPDLPRIVAGRAAAPEEWEAWAEEPAHALVIAADDRAIGSVHVSMVGRHEAWLENLRVRPDFQGQGIARQLVAEAEQVAQHYGATVARTAIPKHEYAAGAVAERSGYHPVLDAVVVETAVPTGPAMIPYDAPVSTPAKDRTPEVVRIVERCAVLQTWDHLVPLGWRFRRLVPELMLGLLLDRRVLLAGDGDGIGLYAIHAPTALVTLIDGTPSGVQAVLGTIMERAHKADATRLVVVAPDLHGVASISGLVWQAHAWCPDGLSIVEKSLTVQAVPETKPQ